jgi:hypothetical protein
MATVRAQLSPSFVDGSCTLVGVHIRRGDFLAEQSIAFGYVPADAMYVRRAMQYYRTKLGVMCTKHTAGITYRLKTCVYFIVLGDDPSWNKQQFNTLPNVHIAQMHHNPAVDMCLLTRAL